VEPVAGVPTWVAAYRGDRITMEGEVTVQSIEVTLKMQQQKKMGSAAQLAAKE
jgi:hypothetical protein